MALDWFLLHEGHVHRLVVTPEWRGWDVRHEVDDVVIRRVHREDWHRVERDVRLFSVRAISRGAWIEQTTLVTATG